jgi:hypothetical protein
VLRIYPKLNQQTAIQFLGYVLERLPFRVEVIQTDNGAEFGSSFHWHVLDKGIGHVYIKPHTPRLNGKVERSHRIDAEEFYRLLDGVVIDDAKVFNDKLREWEDFYNYHRPHAASTARPLMKDSSSEPRPGCNPSPSLAQARQASHNGAGRRHAHRSPAASPRFVQHGDRRRLALPGSLHPATRRSRPGPAVLDPGQVADPSGIGALGDVGHRSPLLVSSPERHTDPRTWPRP